MQRDRTASRASRLDRSLNEVMNFLKNAVGYSMLVGVQKERPKGRYRQYLSKHTPGHRRGHCSAGQSPQMHPAWSPPYSRLIYALCPVPRFDISPATTWSPFRSQMRCDFPQEAVPQSFRGDYMALLRVPKAPALSRLATPHCYPAYCFVQLLHYITSLWEQGLFCSEFNPLPQTHHLAHHKLSINVGWMDIEREERRRKRQTETKNMQYSILFVRN